jgi:hypothetical protein
MFIINYFTFYDNSFTVDGISFTVDGISFTVDGILFIVDGISFTVDGISFIVDGISFIVDGEPAVEAAVRPMFSPHTRKVYHPQLFGIAGCGRFGVMAGPVQTENAPTCVAAGSGVLFPTKRIC